MPDNDLINLYRDAAGKPAFYPELRRAQMELIQEHAEAVGEVLDMDPTLVSSDDFGDLSDNTSSEVRFGVRFTENTKGRPREAMHVELINPGTEDAVYVARIGKFNSAKGSNDVVATASNEDELADMFFALVRAQVARKASLQRSADAVRGEADKS